MANMAQNVTPTGEKMSNVSDDHPRSHESLPRRDVYQSKGVTRMEAVYREGRKNRTTFWLVGISVLVCASGVLSRRLYDVVLQRGCLVLLQAAQQCPVDALHRHGHHWCRVKAVHRQDLRHYLPSLHLYPHPLLLHDRLHHRGVFAEYIGLCRRGGSSWPSGAPASTSRMTLSSQT